MTNPYSQHPYDDNRRALGRGRNERWGSENRGDRSTWREDNSNRVSSRSAWGEPTQYSSSRYSPPNFSPNFDYLSDDDYGREWQAGQGGRDYSDDYIYHGSELQRQRQSRQSSQWPMNDDYENYHTQPDYSFGDTTYGDTHGQFGRENPGWAENPRWQQGRGSQGQATQGRTQGRNYGDSGNFGYRSRGQTPYARQGSHYLQQHYSQQQDDYRHGGEFPPTGAYGLRKDNHRGKGPKGYVRTDERIREDICEYLSDDPYIDAADITVDVRAGVVTLEGSVRDRVQKHRVEDIADSCSGVKDVHNGLRVTAGSTASSSLGSTAGSTSSSTGSYAAERENASKATKQ